MGLSSNVIWHQTKFDAFKNILKSGKFLCSYSLEKIRWRESEITVGIPMISFCDLPISDMHEYLKANNSDKLIGKYGDCTIGLKREWAAKLGMSHVWYHDEKSEFLRRTLPNKNDLLKSLQSKRNHNRWELISRIKPFMGELESKDFKSYRFYDEKEIRYVPKPSELKKKNVCNILTQEEYDKYKEAASNKEKGSPLIPNIAITFKPFDINYIFFSNEDHENEIKQCIKGDFSHIIFMTYSRVVEEIIGTHHYRKDGS